ncbi:MAG: class I SAM-dependent methyltransferase [Solidesulfovibrio sp. DCME]|uniref:class I SAM-dependent methyltransferase n=1 Tax=Solidesulfovibrio sp. DCME TaxID=3447380 RepID=UPI003D0C1FD6
MPQVEAGNTAHLVKHAITLLMHGTVSDWNKHFSVRDFNATIPEKSKDAMFMDFEYRERWKFYHCVNQRFIGNKPIDYLEFGVAGGDSLRSWLRLNTHATSRFYGFDSFRGLPEDWLTDSPKGAFDQQGRLPQFEDDRVSIIDGLFQETVDAFSRAFTPRNRLVIHMDADLYSSTLYCLMHLDRHIRPGTIIFFDEFTARDCTDEYAALRDYCTACYRDYTVIASRPDFVKLALEIVR